MKKFSFNLSMIFLFSIICFSFTFTNETCKSNSLIGSKLTNSSEKFAAVHISKRKNACQDCPLSLGLCNPQDCPCNDPRNDCGGMGKIMIPSEEVTPITDGRNIAWINLSIDDVNKVKLTVLDENFSDPLTISTIFNHPTYNMDEDEDQLKVYADMLGKTSLKFLKGSYPIVKTNGKFEIILDAVYQ